MKKIILYIAFISPGIQLNAQGLTDFYDELQPQKFVLELQHSRLYNRMDQDLSRLNWPEDYAPDYKVGYTYLSFNLNLGAKNAEPGGGYYYWDWRCFSDWLSWANVAVADMIRDDNTKSDMIFNGFISNSWLGFHYMGANVIGNDDNVLRTGVTVADYFYHLSSTGSDSYYARENGNYYTLGPFINYDLLLTDGLVLSLTGTGSAYTFGSNYRPYTGDPEHPQHAQKREFNWGGRKDGIENPLFYFLNAEVCTERGIFFRTEYWGMGRTTDVDKMNRFTFLIGVKMITS